MLLLTRSLALALLAIGLAAAPQAGAVLHVWDFPVTEDQVNNATPEGGSTGSSATGTGHFEYDTDTDVLSYEVTYVGLEGELTAMHVHGPSTPHESVPTHLWDIFTIGSEIPPSVDRHSDTVTGDIVDFLGRAP